MRGRSESDIPKAPLKRILEKEGAKRVGVDALTAFVDVLEDMANKLSKQTIDVASLAGRKTVKQKDVKLAAKQIFGKYF